ASGSHPLDFNGDGRADLLIQFPFTQGASNLYHDVLLYSYGASNGFGPGDLDTNASDPTLLFGNFNDDRCTDVMFTDPSQGTLLFLAPCDTQSGALIPAGGVYTLLAAMDWDGDGRTDVIYSAGGTLTLQL